MPEKSKSKIRVSDTVFEMLKKSIISGVWEPGAKIPSENKLCVQTGASRVSVRAAIHRLSSLGLVESRQGGGTYVCKYNGVQHLNSIIPMMTLNTPDRISMFEFRRIIEVESAAIAAMRADIHLVNQMYEATRNMIAASAPDDIARYDMEFHYLIAKATGNPIIIRVFEILMDTYLSVLTQNITIMGSAGASYHQEITAAIESRNPQLAKKTMEEHLNNAIRKTAAINMSSPPARDE